MLLDCGHAFHQVSLHTHVCVCVYVRVSVCVCVPDCAGVCVDVNVSVFYDVYNLQSCLDQQMIYRHTMMRGGANPQCPLCFAHVV